MHLDGPGQILGASDLQWSIVSWAPPGTGTSVPTM